MRSWPVGLWKAKSACPLGTAGVGGRVGVALGSARVGEGVRVAVAVNNKVLDKTVCLKERVSESCCWEGEGVVRPEPGVKTSEATSRVSGVLVGVGMVEPITRCWLAL